MKNACPVPRVHYATLRNEDTGEITPLYLYSHAEVDAEIDQRIRLDRGQNAAHHNAKRAAFHQQLGAHR